MPTVDLGTITQIMNLKQSAPGLRIYISLGGWDYTNNDTATQPVWGDLSSSTIKRTTFVNNLAKFMRYWGFDGVDLDWEFVSFASSEIMAFLTNSMHTGTPVRETEAATQSTRRTTSTWCTTYAPIGMLRAPAGASPSQPRRRTGI